MENDEDEAGVNNIQHPGEGYTLSSSYSGEEDAYEQQRNSLVRPRTSRRIKTGGNKKEKVRGHRKTVHHGPSPMLFMPPTAMMNSRISWIPPTGSQGRDMEEKLSENDPNISLPLIMQQAQNRRPSIFVKTTSKRDMDQESDMSSPRKLYL